MSVLLLPPIFQFFDNNGDPLANGFVDVFAAGTTTRIATYTSAAGTIEAPNPIQLNAAGRPTSGGGAIWGEGAYKFIVRDANGVQVGDVLDNVTSFAGLVTATNAYAELFSGNGTQTVFTTSSDLGTDPKGLLVSVASGLQELVKNPSFTTDSDWTKGAGITIAAGQAVWTGAVSTALSQVPVIPYELQAYAVTYTMTRSAGGLIPSIGGQNGIERTASGTYREIIIAAASTPLAFTGNAFTGTLDNVSVTVATKQQMALLPTNAYTINGTTLTFASAPALGVSNIDVRAPSLLVGAASTAASLAQVYAANALTSQTAAAISASSAAGYAAARNQWTFSTTTTMADPATANLRLNNASFASVTAIAISDLSANVGNPDLSGWISTWDDAGGSNRGSIFIFKDNGNFAIYNVNSALIDNTTWFQVPVTHVSSAGSFSASDALLIGFSAAGTTLVSGGITQLTSDVIASGAGSVVATIANSAVTNAKMANMAANTVKMNNTGVSAVSIDGTMAQLNAMLGSVLTVKRQKFTSAGTYTPSAGMLFYLAEAVGGGGGSGGVAATASGNSCGSGGGGGAGYSRHLGTAAEIGASKAVAIGAAGTAGASGLNPGGAGGNTTLGSTIVVANGGAGGAGGATGASAAGGVGGTAGTGNILALAGDPGQGGVGLGNVASYPVGGRGGSTFLGFGGQAIVNNFNQIGNAGTGHGSGASGTCSGGTGGANTGVAGQAGVLIITEFCSQ
jgi:hypothetical protein